MTTRMMTLSGGLLNDVARKAAKELGETDRNRLEAALPQFADGKASLGRVLALMYPDHKVAPAQVLFRQFRARFSDAARLAHLDLTLCVDSKKKTRADQRECWFEGTDPAIAEVGRVTAASVEDAPSGVSPKAIATMVTSKKTVKFFFSYAHSDERESRDLFARLREQASSSLRYHYEFFVDKIDILVGKEWKAEILDALSRSDFGLLMAAPGFFGSPFITSVELPGLVKGRKPVIPVGLKPVDLSGHQDLKGIDAQQIFLKSGRPGARMKWFAELRTDADRDAFAHDLFKAIEKRLTDYFSTPPVKSDSATRAAQSEAAGMHCRDWHDDAEEYAYHVVRGTGSEVFVPPRGRRTSFRELEQAERAAKSETGKGVDALNHLEEWALRPDEPPFCAVLGEYGIGKTTALKNLARRLLEKRKKNPKSPLPIFIDLKDFNGKLDPVPTLEVLIDEVLRRNWKADTTSLKAADILRLVREEAAVVIFDGLDEKIVHMTPSNARAFIRELWRTLPSGLRRKQGGAYGKLMISCRSHYFRDVVSQNAMLTGEDREGIKRDEDYRVFLMLPFEEAQIRDYLAKIPGLAMRVDQVMAILRDVHNLRDLASRPYLLWLISEQIGDLEMRRARGEDVNAADLYENMTARWLARDDGKHQIEVAHKKLLMTQLAWDMWRTGVREWEVDRLEYWLDEFLNKNPVIAGAYQNKPREVLKEDFRAATFMVRPDDEKSRFRFAHTSLQEYFLALRMFHSLQEDRPEGWALPQPSPETFEFIGQILHRHGSAACLESLRHLLEQPRPQATRNAFLYWLRASAQDYPRPSAPCPVLRGEDLDGVVVAGLAPDQPLMLQGIDLSGAILRHVRFENVDMSGGSIAKADALCAEFLNARVLQLNAAGCNLMGSIWRDSETTGMDRTDANLQGSEWIRSGGVAATISRPETASLILRTGHVSTVESCAYSPDGTRIVSSGWDGTVRVWEAGTGKALLTLKGHEQSVSRCAYSPDGTRIVSSGWDNTVWVWEAETGKALLTLKGHEGSVSSCAYSPDGARIVSSGWDNTVRVWEVGTGKALLTLKGHEKSVNSCAYSPDGTRIVSSGSDKTVRVWEAGTGKALLTLKGHAGGVESCAYSPDGTRIVSSGWDGTVRVWEAGTGKALLTLKGHEQSVSRCAYSPDGTRIVSSGWDNTVRVWEAETGKALLTLKGHKGYVSSCAYSPDGARIVSSGWDNTVRVWEVGTGKALLTLKGHEKSVNSCAYSPDGTRIVSSGEDNTVRVWEVGTGKALLTLKGHEGNVRSCAYSPDGTRIVSSGWDNTVRVWEAGTGKALLTIKGHEQSVSRCAYSPDGRRIVSSGSDKTVRVWEAETGKALLTIKGHDGYMSSCSYSPDGARIVSSGGDKTVRVWEAETGKALLTIKGHEGYVSCCAYSPDGRRIVSSGEDNTVRVWEARTGKALLTLKGHEGSVNSCAYSPDGRRIVSSSGDSTVRVWDAGTGKALLTLKGHEEYVRSCAYSPDGTRIVSSGTDGIINLWHAESGKLLRTVYFTQDGELSCIEPTKGTILWATSGAWRHLGWRCFDENTGEIKILPAEAFGPLPPP